MQDTTRESAMQVIRGACRDNPLLGHRMSEFHSSAQAGGWFAIKAHPVVSKPGPVRYRL